MESFPGSSHVVLRPHSPSDATYSTGPSSVVSTRETSPASSTHHLHHLHHHNHNHHITTASYPSTAAVFKEAGPSKPQQPLTMDHYNLFQSVNDHRTKASYDLQHLANHASSGFTSCLNNTDHTQSSSTSTGRTIVPIGPPLPQPSSPFCPPSIPRGLSSSDWRTSTTSLDSLVSRSSTTSSAAGASSISYDSTHTHTNNLANSTLSSPVSPISFGSSPNGLFRIGSSYVSIANHVSRQHGNIRPASHSIESFDTDTSTKNIKIAKMYPPNGTIIAEGDMDNTMAYCYDRGDGQYTRLVPADLLPITLKDIPARVDSDEGMIVLPTPRKPGPNGQPANSQLLPDMADTPPSSPTGNSSTDLIQSRIDSIVAGSPNSNTTGPVVLARTNPPTSAVAGKREKIYCDKWIHDGTCAFTQQGCKFKHEMPQDKETQQSLGLFHGYPAWWKKKCAEEQMAIDDRPVHLGPGFSGPPIRYNGAPFPAPGTAITSPSWRRIEGVPGQVGEAPPATVVAATFSVGSSSNNNRLVLGRGRTGGQGRVPTRFPQPNFGPIAPPSQASAGFNGDTRRRRNTLFDSGSPVENNGGARGSGNRNIKMNFYDALEDYGSNSTTKSDDAEDPDSARGAKL